MHPQDLILCQQHGSDDPEYEIWQPKFGIDNFVKTEFTCGACYHLAYALHIKTGWPIYSVLNNHFYVINKNGQAVDIYGVRPTINAPTKYDIDTIEPIKVSEIDNVSNDDYYHWAEKLIKNFPKHFGI